MWRKFVAWLRFDLYRAKPVVWISKHGSDKYQVNDYPDEKISFIIVRGIPDLCVWFDRKAHAVAFGTPSARKFWFWFWSLRVPLEQQ